MINLALIGKDISHSRSKDVYKKLLHNDLSYDLLDYESDKDIPPLGELLKQYVGISVTAPYKEFIYSLLDEEVNPTGLPQINTIKMENDKIIGINTDKLALIEIINNYTKKYNKIHWHVYGSGAMAKLCNQILATETVENYSRKQNNLDFFKPAINKKNIVINCISRDFVFSMPLAGDTLFLDLNYNHPNQDYFESIGIPYTSGQLMLELQAAHALKFWKLK
jgi:shikimate dehydrogenase